MLVASCVLALASESVCKHDMYFDFEKHIATEAG
jgi:hypothetical protein